MSNNKKKIGIIGLGYVGNAVKNWFDSRGDCNIFYYDKFKNIGSVSEVNNADTIFISVPTPFHKDGRGYDDSAVRESLENIEDEKIAVIKSTILPGSSDLFQKEHPKKTILFNPEFLREKTAREDHLNPDIQIVGYVRENDKKTAEKVIAILPPAPTIKIIKARETELVKYWVNSFLATRVIFANEMYDLAKALGGIDYEVVKNCVAADSRVGGSHFDIFTDGYRGYGGACLPKDTKALIQFAQKSEFPLRFLEKADEINEKLRREHKNS